MALPTIDPTLELSVPTVLPFMDGATQKIRDFSGYNRHGTPQNFAGTDVEYVDGWPGQAIQIATPKHVNHGQILDYTASDFSFELIFIPNSIANSPMLFYKGTYFVNGYYIHLTNTGLLRLVTSQGGNAQVTDSTIGVIVVAKRTHVIITRAGLIARIYVDGRETTYSVVGAHLNPLTSSSDFLVGRYNPPGGLDLDSYISRYNSWSRCLGAAEVYERYINAFRL